MPCFRFSAIIFDPRCVFLFLLDDFLLADGFRAAVRAAVFCLRAVAVTCAGFFGCCSLVMVMRFGRSFSLRTKSMVLSFILTASRTTATFCPSLKLRPLCSPMRLRLSAS